MPMPLRFSALLLVGACASVPHPLPTHPARADAPVAALPVIGRELREDPVPLDPPSGEPMQGHEHGGGHAR